MATAQRAPANGVLPVTATQTSGHAPKPAAKPPAPRLKVIVRRLPPGLTEAEFTKALGEEWSLAQGKADWLLYKPGKDSKDPSKPSKPSRAYLHLTSDAHLMVFSETVRGSIFEDAQNSFTSPCLVGPPTVEFAPYSRIPAAKRRVDARSGTIDQDPEFMAFLEGLANPTAAKDTSADALADGSPSKQEKVTTTPLVQFLKDKKASKTRDAAVKAAKKQEAQLAKIKSAKESPEKKGKDGKGDKVVEKAAKEAVKILNREASGKSNASSPAKPGASSPDVPTTPGSSKLAGRQKSAVNAARARMLQRDLGLSPAQAYRQARRDTAEAEKAERAAASDKAATETKDTASPQSTQPIIPTAPKGNAAQVNSRRSRTKVSTSTEDKGSAATTPSIPTTPVLLVRKPEPAQTTQSPPTAPAAQSAQTSNRRPQPAAIPSASATQAFIKHANPSQGVTETLLKEAMEKFGAVSMVEIDKRKGFAYVDFTEPEGLKKAMAANPISVAQGTVQVMQRKGTALPPEKKPTHPAPHQTPRGGRGGGRGGIVGRRGGRGGGRGGASDAPASAPAGPSAKG